MVEEARAAAGKGGPTCEECAATSEQARAALKEWNGYAPTHAEEQDLDSELDRRLARVADR
ncbi:hypothetical protein [Streptomyces sp. NPDC050856]|uniref:hypothetical protein n=1 Tax=Streptomyces sp. NPDC050856 TaxID=3154939 RepID=UPI0033F3E0AF